MSEGRAEVRASVAFTLSLSMLFGVTGCTTILGIRNCDNPSPEVLGAAPPTLSGTGLFGPRGALGPGVRSYRPRFELVGDGDTKSRFIQLPEGAPIDSSVMDDWRFPRGTKLWKHFFHDGKAIETRYLTKVLDGAGADAWLATLVQEGRLTHPARTTYDVPGDASTRATLGYLHANCGHCHNQHRPAREGPRCFDPRTSFDLSLRTAELDSVRATAVYRTALGSLVTVGSPENSILYRRVAGMGTFEPRMPVLGADEVDRNGLALLARWIRGLR
jgi:hypothetical protein